MVASFSFRRHGAAVLVPALMLAACSAEPEPTPAEKAVAARVPGAPAYAPNEVPLDRVAASNVREANDLIDFAYSYPREAAAIPKLAAWLDADRAAKRDALVAAAQRDQTAAARDDFPYHAHVHRQRWQRVTDTRRFLSLSSEIETYMGGAHGMTGFDTMLWDRNRAALRKPIDLFTSAAAFDAAVRDRFCDGIARAKAAKGIRPPTGDDGPFARCPPASAQTVWLGSSDGRSIDRMTIAIAPYEIGPFAEGSYTINLPVTRAVVEALKPDFARDFLPIN